MTYTPPDDTLDNMQRMLDPMNPMDFFHACLRHDWLMASIKHWRCDVAF